MRIRFKILTLLSLVMLLSVGCTQQSKKADITPVKEVKAMKLSHQELKESKEKRFQIPKSFDQNLNDFSVEIAAKHFSESHSQNALISPISIRYAFGTLSEGAGDKTGELFSKLLHETLDQTFSENNSAHKQYLNTAMNNEERGAKLVVKDSLWIDEDLMLKKEFIDKAANYHFAEVYHADLGNQKTADAINQWIKDATNGLIDPKKEADSNADFSKLSDTPLFISDAKQLTKFILNNEGIEAAAYTEIAMKESPALPMEGIQEVEMKLDKPFLYCVLLNDGTPLFIGMMNDPS